MKISAYVLTQDENMLIHNRLRMLKKSLNELNERILSGEADSDESLESDRLSGKIWGIEYVLDIICGSKQGD